MEKFSASAAGVATGTDKTILNLFNPAATPTRRARIFDVLIGSVATPADVAIRMHIARTTAVGTEGAGFTPNNLDGGGPAGECDAGVGVYSVEPTYAASKQLLDFSFNQRALARWVAAPGCELVAAATQNYGLGLRSKSASSGTPAVEATILFEE